MGEVRWTMVPSPTWPSPLSPQQEIAPTSVTAQLPPNEPSPPPPADRPAIGSPPPNDTEAGVERSVVLPSPSRPSVFSPQHQSIPAAFAAHEWASPAANAVAVPEIPVTGVGEGRSVDEPSPIWPLSLSPQQNTSPLATAHECCPPAATVVAPLSKLVSVGDRRPVVLPSPN